MTLTEYLSQEDPQRMPRVTLKRGEFRIGHSSVTAGELRTQIFINEYPHVEYLLFFGQGRLYTTDRDGNQKAMSCFVIELEEMSVVTFDI